MFLSFAMKIFPLLALFYRTITADPVCDLYGNDGCSCTYPPGHSAITSSWWAIGHRAFQATMKSVVVNLLTPPIPTDLHGAIVIIPSLENTNLSDRSDSQTPPQIFQIVTAAFEKNDECVGFCGKVCNLSQDWCTFSSAYSRDDPRPENQTKGMALESQPRDDVPQLNYTFESQENPYSNGSGTIWMQETLQQNTGKQTWGNMTKVTSVTPPWQVWMKGECLCGGNNTIPAHTYRNLSITLDRPITDFDSSISYSRSNFSKPYTLDGGITWKIDEINISDGWCVNNNQTCSANPFVVYDVGTPVAPLGPVRTQKA